MPIQSILVATDHSVPENAAVTRALQLARAHDATLKVEVLPAKGDAFEGLAAKAQGVDLIVLPDRQERSLATFFRGRPVMRLLRECHVPVLVARTAPGKTCTRMVVAVDFSAHSVALTEFARGLHPQAELRLLHALGTGHEAKLVFAGAAQPAITAYRERCLAHARMKMLALASHFTGDRHRLMTHISRGDPARQAVKQQERSGAGLIVVGMAQDSSCSRFLTSGVAQRILCWGRSDVLIVPHTDSKALAPKRPSVHEPAATATLSVR